MAAVITRFAPVFMSRLTPKSSAMKKVRSPSPEEPDAEGDLDSDYEAMDQEQSKEAQVDAGDEYSDSDGGEEADEAEEGSDAVDKEESEEEETKPNQRRLYRKRQPVPKMRHKRTTEADEDEDSEEEDISFDEDVAESEASEVETSWEAEDEVDIDAEEENRDPNRCIFCQETEENDPGEEFEEMLNCSACGDYAHRQCARDAESVSDDNDDITSWRCPECVDKDIGGDDDISQSRSRRQSSASRMTRDLLPPQRAVKAGSHSMFADLILKDDPLDGTRPLRKRKSSHEEDHIQMDPRKRRRGSSEVIVLANRHNFQKMSPSLEANLEDHSTPIGESLGPDGAPRSARLRQRKSDKPIMTTIVRNEDQFILSFNFGSAALLHVREETRKKKRRDRDRARRSRRAEQHPAPPPRIQEVSHYPALQLSSFSTGFFDLHEREGDGPKSKPYGGILSDAEADTTRTFPQLIDRKKFESARLRAEEEWKKKLQAAAVEQARTSQKATSQPSKIKCIHFGGYEIDTFHASPYPEEYSRNRVLHVCEFCLKYMNSDFVAWRHKLKCPARHPPGDEIYHDGTFSFFEVDGRKNPVYCQNLCLLAKLFLGSKTLYYDVEPFLFYVMTENNNEGCHFVGYFSKEKRSSSQNNVSCILVLPIHQRRGFGHMLIEFSYLLTKVEKKTGSPEKPLSDMGLVSYRNYWRRILCAELLRLPDSISIVDISEKTGMTADDIVCALEGLRALVRDPVTKTYALRLDFPYYKQYLEAYEKKRYHKIDPDALMWVPYQMGRTNSHYENAAIQTVAQREEEPTAQPEEAVQLAEQDVAIHDFGHATSEEGHNRSETTQEDGSKRSDDVPFIPFPTLDKDKESSGRRKTHPSTPLASFTNSETPIPPTRFEVFPPLPGSHRRRPGRPFGSRNSNRRGTPLRRGVVPPETPNSPASSARRTRSALADMVNGHNGAEMGTENGTVHVSDDAVEEYGNLAGGDVDIVEETLRD